MQTHNHKKIMKSFILLISIFIIFVQAGKDDTIEDLKVGLGNIDMNHEWLQEPVEITHGKVPDDLEGTFVRHGCGAFGNVAEDEPNPWMLDRIDHLFDCIEIDQSFSFHNGLAYFNSRFYDTNIVRIFRGR